MKVRRFLLAAPLLAPALVACQAQKHLMLDVHHLGPGKVKLEDVADAHRHDLAVQGTRDVEYQRYWVDESSGTIYCLVEAPSAEAASAVHREAHGLVADELGDVVPGILPAPASGAPLFMDTHRMGPGVRAEDVADAHRKDLAVQAAHGVRFLDYWVDEQAGTIHCLAEAPNADAIKETHREAHGLVPETVLPVVEGH